MMKKSVLSSVIMLALTIVLMGSIPAMAATDIGNLSLEQAVENALKNSVASVEMANNVAKTEEQKKQTDSAVKRAWDKLKEYSLSSKEKEENLNQTEYEQLVLTPKLVDNGLQSLYLAQKQLDIVTRISTSSMYFGVAAKGRTESAAYNSLIKAQRHYKDTQAMYKEGVAAKMELLNAEIQQKNAEIELKEARNKTAQAKRDLCIQMGISADSTFKISSKMVYTPLKVANDEAATKNLREKSLSIQIDKITLDSATLQYNLVLRTYAVNTYGYRIGTSEYNIAKKQYENAKNQLVADSYKFMENLRQAESQYLIAKKNKELAEEVYRLAELKYKNGLATQTDVLDAAAQVTAVDAQVIGALLQYNMYFNAFEYDYILLTDIGTKGA
ncbi:MAG: TolC family protein [Clostridia bacterium]|jgi:outer membrane protein TolC|nr:TolC family protein [Clostridia bacterium]